GRVRAVVVRNEPGRTKWRVGPVGEVAQRGTIGKNHDRGPPRAGGGQNMVQQLAFLISTTLTVGVSALVVVSLRRSLQGILVDLCGTESRARFWRAYANIVLLLVPLTTLMLARADEVITGSLLFAVIDQTRWALVGLIAALFMVAMGVAAFIPSRTS